MDNRAFTYTSDKRVNCLITPVGLCQAFDPMKTMQRPGICTFSALWDTGATNSVINKDVAKKLGLKPIGIGKVCHANGTAEVSRYFVNIFLPNNIMIPMFK